VEIRPHCHPQRVKGVLAWTQHPAIIADVERRVVIRHLGEELLGPEVGRGAAVCLPQDHS